MEAELLLNRWLHSHEEDYDDVVVYRPETFPFPPSRGRSGFELRADNSCEVIGLATSDGAVPRPGKWRLDEAPNLIIEEAAGRAWVARIESVTLDRLVVRPARHG